MNNKHTKDDYCRASHGIAGPVASILEGIQTPFLDLGFWRMQKFEHSTRRNKRKCRYKKKLVKQEKYIPGPIIQEYIMTYESTLLSFANACDTRMTNDTIRCRKLSEDVYMQATREGKNKM